MPRLFRFAATTLLLLHWPAIAESAEPPLVPTNADEFSVEIRPFLVKYCFDCHGDSGAEAEFRLDNIDGVVSAGRDIERWEKALEMISIGNMPPADADLQPGSAERKQITNWITVELKKIGRGPDEARLARPEYGNRVNHEDLFSGKFKGPPYSPSRIWRKNAHIHAKFERTLRLPKGTNPFSPRGGRGFQDYAMLFANEATITAMRINASDYAADQLDGKLVHPIGDDGKPDKSRRVRDGRGRWREFNELIEADSDVTEEQLAAAVSRTFELLLNRKPNELEQTRYREFLRKGIEIAGRREGVEALLTAVMLSPEFIYRMELGLGKQLPDGRRMLSPDEIAYAVAFALTDSPPDDELMRAVAEGRLATKEEVAREVRRILATDTRPYWSYEINHTFQNHVEACPNPRVLRFFREFFGYHGVFDVFKDKSRNQNHKPKFLFKDADLFVLAILEEDRQVLKQLLTSNRYVVHYSSKEQAERRLKSIRENIEKHRENNRENGRKNPVAEKIAKGLTPVLGGYRGGQYYTAYNLQRETWDYPIQQPFSLPNRYGMLTHPAWLVAHSGNFDTDPIRRGKWIRERLLADIIPEIPIGVDAALEDNPHKTLREKLAKTTEAKCWRCHKKMNPLGLPLESYDDFGAYRTEHYFDANGEIVATEFERERLIQLGKQRKHPEAKFTSRPIDTSGYLSGTGDPELDGKVDDARDLLHRLARSDRVRQSFIRHAFRYWMGRNETLADSPTLIAADQAYLESDGSFKELLVSLLTSDSFLMRR